MRSRKPVRISASFFLFLTIVFFLINPVTSKGQSKSTTANLTDTAWKGPIIHFETSDGPATVQAFYVFGKDGKVTERGLAMKLSQIQAIPNFLDPMFNPFTDDPNKWKLTTTPLIPVIVDEVGKYEVNGSTLYLDFANRSVTATINGNEITGISTKKDSNKKEEWKVQRIPNVDASISNPNPESTSSMDALLKKVIEKYNPARLTTNTISGQLNTGNSSKQYYYIFTAMPDELTITLNVESEAQSSLNSVQFVLLDVNENVLGSGMTMSNYGRAMQAKERFNITTKKPVLLRIEANNLGSGKFRIQLTGAFETAVGISLPPNVNRDASGKFHPATGYRWVNANDPNDLRVEPIPAENKSEQPASGMNNRQKAEAFFSKATDLKDQKKYREAIEEYSKVIQLNIEGDPIRAYEIEAPYTMWAYKDRGDAKLELQDYRGAIEDYSRVIQLCFALKAGYANSKYAEIADAVAKLPPNPRGYVLPPEGETKLLEKLGSVGSVEYKKYEKVRAQRAWVSGGLTHAYFYRGTAKSRMGDTTGACDDFRALCLFIGNDACEISKQVCN